MEIVQQACFLVECVTERIGNDLVEVSLPHLAEANFLESLDHDHTNCINLWSSTRDSNVNGLKRDCTCRRMVCLLFVCLFVSRVGWETRACPGSPFA